MERGKRKEEVETGERMGKRPRKDGELSDDAVNDDEGMMDEGSEEAEEEEWPTTLQPAAPTVEGIEVVKSASPAPRAKGPSTPSKNSQSANKLVVAKPLPAFKVTPISLSARLIEKNSSL